jgi:hypothetical protein
LLISAGAPAREGGGGRARPVRELPQDPVFALPSVDLVAGWDFAERVRLKVSSCPWEDLESRLDVTIRIGEPCAPAANWRSVLAQRASVLAVVAGPRTPRSLRPELPLTTL